jgi:hypothetical protein
VSARLSVVQPLDLLPSGPGPAVPSNPESNYGSCSSARQQGHVAEIQMSAITVTGITHGGRHWGSESGLLRPSSTVSELPVWCILPCRWGRRMKGVSDFPSTSPTTAVMLPNLIQSDPRSDRPTISLFLSLLTLLTVSHFSKSLPLMWVSGGHQSASSLLPLYSLTVGRKSPQLSLFRRAGGSGRSLERTETFPSCLTKENTPSQERGRDGCRCPLMKLGGVQHKGRALLPRSRKWEREKAKPLLSYPRKTLTCLVL